MKGSELKAMLGWIKQNVQDNEPVLLKFPRREARKRICNTENRKRIAFTVDPVTYVAFHAEKERLMAKMGDNPVLFGLFLTDVMKGFTEELLDRWMEIHEGEKHVEQESRSQA